VSNRYINLYRHFVADPIATIVFGVTLSVWLPSLWHANLSDRFNYSGLMLQLFGFGLVGYGMHETLNEFGRKGFRSWLINWGKRWVGAFKKPIIAHAKIEMHGLSMSAALTSASLGSASTPTLDERVTALERKLNAAEQEIANAKGRIEEEIRNRIAAIHAEENARAQSNQQMRSLIEKLTVGGMTLEIVGFVWVLIGTVFSTIPIELAGLLGMLF